jgi:hypothetical protein
LFRQLRRIIPSSHAIDGNVVLTDSGHRANGINVLNALLGFDLQAHNDRFVGGSHVSRDVDSVGNARECRALPSQSIRREFGTGNDALCVFDGVDLGHNNPADEVLAIVSGAAVLKITTGNTTHCAPASNALLIKSVCVIRIRTSGETPIDAMAAVALCIASSLMWPCSQSMMTP